MTELRQVINWNGMTQTEFNDMSYRLMKALESTTDESRFELQNVEGNPTIGIGFDLETGGGSGKKCRTGRNGGHLDPDNGRTNYSPLSSKC